MILIFGLHFDVNLRHKIFLNLIFKLRKIILKNLETKFKKKFRYKKIKFYKK